MIVQLLKRRIGPESLKAQLIQGSVILIAAIIFVAGFRKLSEMDLTEAQMLLGFGIVFSLVLQCFILWVLVDVARSLARKDP